MENDSSNCYFEEDSSDDEAPDLIEVLDENPTSAAVASTAPTRRINENVNVKESSANACPVTILSGFLGSGKTTLIQHILKSPDHGKRIAVIENEFGEGLAIESLIARDGIDPGSGSLQDLIELPNGCVCCTVKDSLVETLEILISKRSDLDYILIEASGMADPGPIASVFWLDDALESRLKLDGIVTLVDGRHILGQLEATEEAARQIAYADRIVLNKVDLLAGEPKSKGGTTKKVKAAKPTSVLEVEQALRNIHPTAPILKTSFSKIPDLNWILDADCFSGFENLEEVQNSLEIAQHALETDHIDDCDHNHDHGHGHHHSEEDDHDCSQCCHGDETNDRNLDHHDHSSHNNHHNHHHKHEHKHTTSITTIALEHSGSVNVRKLNSWLAEILWPNQDETDEVLTALLYSQDQENENIVAPSLSKTSHTPSAKNDNCEQQIFRIKGIVSIFSCEDFVDPGLNDITDGSEEINEGLDPRRFIVQAVHDLWDVKPVTSKDLHWGCDEERTGKVVVIGKFLEEEKLRTGFNACFEPSPA